MQRDPMANARQIKDPLWQAAIATRDQIKAKIPGLREQLPVRHDVAGKPLTNQGSWPEGLSLVSPFYKQKAAQDPVASELIKHGMGLSYAKPTIPAKWAGGREMPMPPQLFEQYQQLHDEELHKAVGRVMSLPSYQSWKAKDQVSTLKHVLKGVRNATLARMAPQIGEAVKERTERPSAAELPQN